MSIMEIIFANFWTWAGTVVLVATLLDGLANVIAAMRSHVTLPVAAYHVSGEYLMIKSAAASGWLDEREAVLETLTSIRRAGADMILTYYAPQAAEWLKQER